jgi:hypothetical protein
MPRRGDRKSALCRYWKRMIQEKVSCYLLQKRPVSLFENTMPREFTRIRGCIKCFGSDKVFERT